jgi:serine/threonine protein kinase
MSIEADSFRDLLDRWEELREAGQEPDVDELCRDCPQFAERLRDWTRTLKMTDWLSRSAEEAASDTWDGADKFADLDRQQHQIIGEYELLEELGSGGMGRVFRAVHRKLHRQVALKLLPPTAVHSPESVERFQREIQALAKLSHANIVTVHDAGNADGTHYFAMDLVAGKDLSRVVKDDGPVPPERAVDYVLQVARGLEYAHAAGIVHRDIKPSNLMLDSQGQVRILDLGIARVAEMNDVPADLTRTGSILGTVDYMPPEQALNTRMADQRADVYSLGCTLYFILTGKPVYGGETVMERLVAHREHPVPSLRAGCSAAPAWLDQVFQRMIAKRPEERIQSMAEVISALEQKAAPQRWHRFRIAIMIVLLVLCLGVAGILVSSAWHNSSTSQTWRMNGDYPLIAGKWKEWDGIFLDITQHGERFSADCTYGQPGVTVHWQADGTISHEGKITAQLVHTDPPRTAPVKPETCTAQLQPDGQTIRGRAAWTNGGEDFIWRLQEP